MLSLPASSTAVQRTSVLPMGNSEPDGGSHSTVAPPQSSVAVASYATAVVPVDEQAWIYVNGQLAGEHTVQSETATVDDLWDQPFSIEVRPEHLKYGEKNLLVVRVHNSAANGGIWKPVIGGLITPEEEAGLDQIDQYF